MTRPILCNDRRWYGSVFIKDFRYRLGGSLASRLVRGDGKLLWAGGRWLVVVDERKKKKKEEECGLMEVKRPQNESTYKRCHYPRFSRQVRVDRGVLPYHPSALNSGVDEVKRERNQRL